MKVGAAGQFADKGSDASYPELDVYAIRPDIDALDQETNDAGLLGWKKFIPERVERLQRIRAEKGEARYDWRAEGLVCEIIIAR